MAQAQSRLDESSKMAAERGRKLLRNAKIKRATCRATVSPSSHLIQIALIAIKGMSAEELDSLMSSETITERDYVVYKKTKSKTLRDNYSRSPKERERESVGLYRGCTATREDESEPTASGAQSDAWNFSPSLLDVNELSPHHKKVPDKAVKPLSSLVVEEEDVSMETKATASALSSLPNPKPLNVSLPRGQPGAQHSRPRDSATTDFSYRSSFRDKVTEIVDRLENSPNSGLSRERSLAPSSISAESTLACMTRKKRKKRKKKKKRYQNSDSGPALNSTLPNSTPAQSSAPAARQVGGDSVITIRPDQRVIEIHF